MGKKRASTALRSHSQPVPSLTLREESSGKKQSSVNAKSMLKLDHLKNLSIWASGEACIPSLGAVFGHRLAATAEALGVPPDPSLFSCQRCESVLQPGYNCTVRIEKIKAKAKRKHRFPSQNSVVYKCNFCSHQNLKRGTPKGYMKDLCPPKAKLPSKSDLTECTPVKSLEAKVSKDDPMPKMENIGSPDANLAGDSPKTPDANLAGDSPKTPSTKVGTLLDMGKRKRSRSRSKKTDESKSSSVTIDSEKPTTASSKRKRKSWTSLKDIAERNEQDSSRNLNNLTIPFLV